MEAARRAVHTGSARSALIRLDEAVAADPTLRHAPTVLELRLRTLAQHRRRGGRAPAPTAPGAHRRLRRRTAQSRTRPTRRGTCARRSSSPERHGSTPTPTRFRPRGARRWRSSGGWSGRPTTPPPSRCSPRPPRPPSPSTRTTARSRRWPTHGSGRSRRCWPRTATSVSPRSAAASTDCCPCRAHRDAAVVRRSARSVSPRWRGRPRPVARPRRDARGPPRRR